MRAGETEGDTVDGEERAKGGVDEFAAVIALNTLNKFVELCFNVGEETW
jgi:hypothetical protein